MRPLYALDNATLIAGRDPRAIEHDPRAAERALIAAGWRAMSAAYAAAGGLASTAGALRVARAVGLITEEARPCT